MTLRWYSTVVDCQDVSAQADWWAAALGWKTAYESEDEVILVPQHATPELVASLPWEQIPPGLVFVRVPEGKTIKNRLHLDLAPHTSDDRDAEIARLVAAGATQVDIGQGDDADGSVLADPEGNEFCVLSARDT